MNAAEVTYLRGQQKLVGMCLKIAQGPPPFKGRGDASRTVISVVDDLAFRKFGLRQAPVCLCQLLEDLDFASLY